MTLKWVAERLKMGAWTHVTNRLERLKKCCSHLGRGFLMARPARTFGEASVKKQVQETL